MKFLILLLVASACLVQAHAVENKGKTDDVSVKGASDVVSDSSTKSVKSGVGETPQLKITAEKPKEEKHVLSGLLSKVKKVITRSRRDTTAEHKESTMGKLFSKIKSIGRKSAPKAEAGTRSKAAETKAEKSHVEETSAKPKKVTEDTKADEEEAEEEQSEKDDKVEHLRRKRSSDGESKTKRFFKKIADKFHKSGATNAVAPAPAPESKPKMSLTRKIFGDLDDEEEEHKGHGKRKSDDDDEDWSGVFG